jgi:hypothetical protein
MSKRRYLVSALGSAAVAAAIVASSPPAVAEESGHWEGKGVLVITARTMVKVEDSANHSVGFSEWDGAIFNGEGKSFLDKARYQVASPLDTAGARSGYKTFSDGDGSKVFAKYTPTEVKPPEFRGTFTFTGGTGRYEGITGDGTYHLVMVSDKAAWDELVGNYKLPAPLVGSSTPPTGNDAKNR